MKIKRMIMVATLAGSALLSFAAPAQANHCNDAPVPALYKKLTGREMFHCPHP